MKQSTRNIWLQAITGSMIILLLLWQGLRPRPVAFDSGFFTTMGTFARIQGIAPDQPSAERAVEDAMAAIDRVVALMNDYDPASQISQVNQRAFDEPVSVDAALFEVLQAAMCYSELSDGAFDITIGPVVRLWRQARKTGTAPGPEQIEDAHGKVGVRHLILDPQERTVRFAVDGMALDVGGIAKGYAIDKAVEAMRQAGALGGIVDIGGDLLCFGEPLDGQEHWRIGLQDPADEGNLLLRLRLDDRAVATSGNYRRFTLVNGRKYSHIVNPATADAADDLSSVTIIAPTATQADALATAVSVLGIEKGLALIESLPDTEALVICASAPQAIGKTAGAARFIDPAPTR